MTRGAVRGRAVTAGAVNLKLHQCSQHRCL